MSNPHLVEVMVTLVFATPALYLVLLVFGRWLKRQGGVRLGVMYQLFALSMALFLPLSFLEINFTFLKVLGSIVAMLGTIFLLSLIKRFFWELYFQERRRVPAPKFMVDVVALLIFFVAVMLVLTFILQVRIPGTVLAGSGIFAVVLGLAMQDTLGNIIAGFALHFEKPFQPGDWLIVENRHAEVMEVNWRATRLRTNDHIYLDIPNNQISRQAVVNLSYPDPVHAMRLSVGIDYRVPPNTVKDALRRAAGQAQGVLAGPPPKVFLMHFGDSAITYEVKFWMDDHSLYNEVVDAIQTNVWYELQRQQIKIPFPIRTLQIESPAATEPPGISALHTVLRQQPLFQCLDDAQRDTLFSQARHYRFGRGEKLIEQGETGDSMFVLLRGEASVVVSQNGQPTRVAALRGGDCFGEMSLLTGEKRSATVVAQTDCEVAQIDKASLAGILQSEPSLLNQLSELLAKRRLETEGIMAESALKPGAGEKQREYSAGFLKRLRSFFEL